MLLLLLIGIVAPFRVSAQGGYALDFNGTNEYVEAPYDASLNPANFTLEAWAKVEGGSGAYRSVITSRSTSSNTRGYIIYAGSDNQWQFWTGENSAGIWDELNSGVAISNEWTHIACSFDGTTKRMYLNGVLVASAAGSYFQNTTRPLRIGTGVTEGTPDFYFPGKIDEVRIWSDVRTLAEIQANMHKELVGNEANLAAYYQMSNGSGTSLTDNSSNSNTGTFTNSPDWKTSGAHAGPKQALDFGGGANQYVSVPDAASLDITGTAITLEAWINADNWETNVYEGYIVSKESIFTGYMIRTGNNGQIEFVYGNGSAWEFLTSATGVLTAGQWEHVAAVLDGTDMIIYINGVETISKTVSTSIAANNEALLFGTSPSFGTTRIFDGKIDEIRIWSDARSQAEIRTNMYRTLEGDEPNLVAYHRFDQQADAGQTTAYDLTSNANNGTLINMTPASNWVSSSPFNTWIGSEDSDWSNGDNWSSGSAPSSTQGVGIFSWNATTNAPASANISARNFYVDGSVTLSHSGDLTLSDQFYNAGTFTTTGNVTFSGSAAQTIEGTGTTTFGTTIINNSNGVTLDKDITTTNLTLTDGTFSIGDNTLTLNGAISGTSSNLTGGGTSNMIIGGSGASTTLAAITLNNLSLNRANGISLGGDVTIGGSLTLTNGSLSIGANTLTINGNLTSTSGGLTGGSTSNLTINGTTPSISLAGVTLNNVILNRTSGISLNGTLTVDGSMTLTDGIIDLNSNTLILGNSTTIAGSPAASNHVNATSGGVQKGYGSLGSFVFPIGDGTDYTPITLNFTSGALSSASATVGLTNGKHSDNTSDDYLTRYWTVTSSGISGFSCDVTAQYTNGDINGTESNLQVIKWDGSSWADLGAATIGSNQLTGTVSSFSDFTGGDPATFPVEWLSFSAKVEEEIVRLDWSTATEINSDFFVIERGTDSDNWVSLGKVQAAGYSTQTENYQFEDEKPLGVRAYYRLRQVDQDGVFAYSSTVEVLFKGKNIAIYPNPVQDILLIELSDENTVKFRLMDIQGRVLIKTTLKAGINSLSVAELPAGIYVLVLRGDSGIKQRFRIVKE